jgi:DGQHR domain-containing protein
MATPKRIQNKTTTYYALENIQRDQATDLKFYLFHASASEIAQWGLVDRLAPEAPKGIQRSLNKTKVRKIEEYLTAFESNTIATSVVVVFDKKSISFSEEKRGLGRGTLDVKWNPKNPAGVIVDGQHRVMGANNYNDGNIHLNVVGIVGADSTEGAFQFLVINNNSSKVSPSHVKALFSGYKEEELLKRMLDSGSTNIDSEKITALDYLDRGVDSPFKGQIKWAKNHNGYIVSNALESGLREIENRTALLGVEDLELDTFSEIWTSIKKLWPQSWGNESHLLEKATIQALSGFVADSLVQQRLFSEDDIDYRDPELLDQKTIQILKKIDSNFFDVEWSTTGLDTRAGQELLIADLKQMASNSKGNRPWHNGLQTVSIAAVGGKMPKKGSRPKKTKS